MKINGETYGKLTKDSVREVLDAVRNSEEA
jgi:NADH:ubiquinone oxidoreductase subunit E